MTEPETLRRALQLARAYDVGPRTAHLLLTRVSLEELDRLGVPALVARGVPRRIAESVCAPGLEREAREELRAVREAGDALLHWREPGYPPALRAIYDPPLVLAVRGGLLPSDARAVAIVGARRATPAGREIAHRLGFDLAASGVVVVSGMARGIDQAAHRGALEAGGRTLAVLGCGLGVDYPAGRLARQLAARIAAQGALLSEFAPLQGPSKFTFPQRNRIVAGLSLGVVVVEASATSGALITADFALQSGRELFAVPGSVLDPLSRGPNGLLKDGAHVVESAADVLEVLFGVDSPSLTPAEEAVEVNEAS